MSKRFNELSEKLMSNYLDGRAPGESIKAMMGELLNVYQFVDMHYMKMLCSVTRSIAFIEDIEDELKSSASQYQVDLEIDKLLCSPSGFATQSGKC
nr:expressed protein [Hymenolepis microstoma]